MRQLIESIIDSKYCIIGYPRLIRLNPNIPWKTRGNGALAIEIGEQKGRSNLQIGGAKNKIFVARKHKNTTNTKILHTLKPLVKEVIENYSQFDDDTTNPGAVFLPTKPSYQLYKKAVTNILTIQNIKKLLKQQNASILSYKNERGLIGATAAIAWEPRYDHTYELITYRLIQKWGTKRKINKKTVQKMDSILSTTFDNYDYIHQHNRLAPNSPCPVLYGIRGDNPDDLIQAKSMISSEKIESWILFQTNQATDDHLQQQCISEITPFSSAITQGTVKKDPHTIHGGHVLFTIKDESGEIDVAAYEPTKEFRVLIRCLRIGDQVKVYGGVRCNPFTLNLEKIQILELKTILQKKENPLCPKCMKHMKSVGKNKGYRCKKCKTFSKDVKKEIVARQCKPGWYEAPVSARRHLSKPLKRMINQKN